MKLRPLTAVLLPALLLAASCGRDKAEPSPAATPTAPVPSATEWGVTGVIPPHFPAPTNGDLARLFDSYTETGSLVGVYLNWADSPQAEGQVPRGVASVNQAISGKGLKLVVALGTASDTGGGTMRSTVNWADAAQRARFMDAVRHVATEIAPPYLAIGVEINRLWETDPAAFDQFVDGYREAYAVAKKAAPTIVVFPVFQLEMMEGKAFLMASKVARQPEWDLLAKFDGALDAVGLTSYPFLDYETPEAIPADYFRRAAQQAGKPVILTELGWPSRPLSSAPASGFGGSVEEQAQFIRALPRLIEGANVPAALWSFPFDLGPGAPVPFESVALRENDGTEKPALAAWRTVIAR